MSKGSKQRPTNLNKFNENFDKIFGDKKCHKKDDNAITCPQCGEVDESDISVEKMIDREPYGDQIVDRVNYYNRCNLCGEDGL